MSKRPIAVYKDCIVTFLDLLGFSHLVDRGADAAEITGILDALEKATQIDSDEGQLWSESRIVLSDSVVQVTEVPPVNNPIGLDFRFLLLGLVHAQAELVHQGIILRGAIVRGDAFLDDSIGHGGHARVFGPAYQAAYKMENDEEFPRIVVAEDFIEAIKQGELGYAQERPQKFREYLDELLVWDSDNGVYWVDYLYMAHSEVDSPSIYCKYLAAHRDLIQRRLGEHAGAPEVLRKYVWLAGYHNRTLRKFDPEWSHDYCGVDLDTLAVDSAGGTGGSRR